ncbi:MAG: hypothetical protein K6B14_07810 [Lachnospiraceae bacterium]|nr:hypothetical protein [Lachnospiraceae bacterium]
MIAEIGDRFPRLFFCDEGEAFYFKEDVILPEAIPPKPVQEIGMSRQDHRDLFINCVRGSCNIAAGRRISDRVLATVRLSQMLGIEDIVAPAEISEIEFEGERLFGVKIPPISGANTKELDAIPDLKGYSLGYTVDAVRQLTQLVVFDFICAQLDRHSRNIRLKTDIDYDSIVPPAEGRQYFLVLGICAIDHDMSFGEVYYEDIQKRVSKGLCICPELLGQLQYTAVDEAMCKRMFDTTETEYRDALSEYLSEEELLAFFDRIHGLKRVLDNERQREDEMKSRGEEFFSRFISSDEMYAEYLSRMEEGAKSSHSWDLRFSYHPSYLKKKILLHTPLSGMMPDVILSEAKDL